MNIFIFLAHFRTCIFFLLLEERSWVLLLLLSKYFLDASICTYTPVQNGNTFAMTVSNEPNLLNNIVASSPATVLPEELPKEKTRLTIAPETRPLYWLTQGNVPRWLVSGRIFPQCCSRLLHLLRLSQTGTSESDLINQSSIIRSHLRQRVGKIKWTLNTRGWCKVHA